MAVTPRRGGLGALALGALALLVLGIIGAGIYFAFFHKPETGPGSASGPNEPAEAGTSAYVLHGPPAAVSFANGATLVPVISPAPAHEYPANTVWWVYKGAPESGSVGLVPSPDGASCALVAFGAPDAPERCVTWAVSKLEEPGAPSGRWPNPPSPGVWAFASPTPVPLPSMRLARAPAVAPTQQQLPACLFRPCPGGACELSMECRAPQAACTAPGSLPGTPVPFAPPAPSGPPDPADPSDPPVPPVPSDPPDPPDPSDPPASAPRCAGVAGGECAGNTECHAPGTPEAACIVPGSLPVTPIPSGPPAPPAPSDPPAPPASGLVRSGLVVHLDAADVSGGAMANLASPGAPATLLGKYEPTTVGNRRAIRIVNVLGPAENTSCIRLPEVPVRTLSLWFYVTFVTSGMVFLFDGRDERPNVGDGTYVVPRPLQLGERVEGAVAYLNGSAAPLSEAVAPVTALSSSWQHLTIVLRAPVRSALKLFARHSYEEGMDVCVGRVLVYDRALTEAENRAIYDASF